MAKYTPEQISSLPDDIQDHYFDPEIDERYVAEIYPLTGDDKIEALQDLVLDVYFKKLSPSGFVSALREIVPDEKVYKDVLIKVLGYDFLPIADEIGADVLDLIQKNGGDPLLFRAKVPVSDVLDQIKKKIVADIPRDERMAHRLENILKSKVTNARTDDQVKEMLTGNPKTSGIGLPGEKAAAIILFANEEMKKLEQRNVVVVPDEEYERESRRAEEPESPQVGEPEVGEPGLEEQGEGSGVQGEGSEEGIETGGEGEPIPAPEEAPQQPEEKAERRGFDEFGAEDKQEIQEFADELGPSGKTVAQKAVEITLETLADEALGASGIPFDDDMRKRFRYVVDLFHRDLRDELETRSKLTMAVSSGGMGLSEEQAEKVMALLKTRIGEYRTFMSAKTSADKEKYVAERVEREASRGTEEERRRNSALDRRFRQLTGKETPLPGAPEGGTAEPAAPPMPKRVAVVAEEEPEEPKIEVGEPESRKAEEPKIEAGEPESLNAEEPAIKKAEPPPELPVVGEPLSDLEALRKEMAEPSDEQMLASAAVGAVSKGEFIPDKGDEAGEPESRKAGEPESRGAGKPESRRVADESALVQASPQPVTEPPVQPASPKPAQPVVVPAPPGVVPQQVPKQAAPVPHPAPPPAPTQPLERQAPKPAIPVSPPAIPPPVRQSLGGGGPRSSTPSATGKPMVSDIKFTPKLTGPVEELRATTLADFRRLSKDPKEAILKIKDKLDLLAQQSHELKLAGGKAWQESHANKAYLDVLKESLAGKPVADVLRAREGDPSALKRAEFEAIMELNRTIRFG